MNWSEVRTAAQKLLEHPESYPGLAARAPSRQRLRIWRYPSFEPFVSWSALDMKGNLFLRRVVWDQTPTRLADPITYGSESPLEAEVFKTIIASLQLVSIQPFVPSGSVGLDGARYGVEVSDFMSAVRFSWWQEHPPAWAPLRDWHEHTVATFETLLPQHSVTAAP